jgi:hypothetical protein
MMHRQLPLTAALAVALAATAACSSSTTAGQASVEQTTPVVTAPSTTIQTSTAPPPQTVPDACTLLTRAEAIALAGVPLEKGQDSKASTAADIASCAYDAPVTGSSGSVQLFVQLSTPRALGIDKAIHHKFRIVPGIGDQTLEEPENASIFVRKGQVWVYLDVPYGATPKRLEAAATKIASRLP